MPTRHTISNADELFRGDAYKEAFAGEFSNRRGIKVPAIVEDHFTASGEPTATAQKALTIDEYWTTTSTGTAATSSPSDLSLTGTGVSGGVYTNGVPMNIRLTTTATVAGTAIIKGTDVWGDSITENIAFPGSATSTDGVKAFLTVSSVAFNCTDNITSTNTLALGQGVGIGLSYRLPVNSKFVGVVVNGQIKPTTTITSATDYATSTDQTATTNDTRGLITPTDAPDGSTFYTALYIVDTSSKENLFGKDQYTG